MISVISIISINIISMLLSFVLNILFLLCVFFMWPHDDLDDRPMTIRHRRLASFQGEPLQCQGAVLRKFLSRNHQVFVGKSVANS